MQMLKYSLIVPIYNEEETIAELYRRVSAIMNNLDGAVELILVNDGSKDRLFGLCYAMDGDYKGWNPYIERHLAIFVNCFLSRAN